MEVPTIELQFNPKKPHEMHEKKLSYIDFAFACRKKNGMEERRRMS
jgi:hypothetical protein